MSAPVTAPVLPGLFSPPVADFPLWQKAPADEKVMRLLPTLLDALDGHGWRSARELTAALGTDDRTIRAMAAASDGRIISGQQGYHLTRTASVDAVNHAASWLEHQADQMRKRAYAIRQNLHR